MPDASTVVSASTSTDSNTTTNTDTPDSTGAVKCECDDMTTVNSGSTFEVIQIEGQHNKQVVDTRDGVVRVVGEDELNTPESTVLATNNTFINESARCCCGPGTCNCTDCGACVDRQERKMKRVRLKLKRRKRIKEEDEVEEGNQKVLDVPKVPIEIEEVFVAVGNGYYRKEKRNKLTGEVIIEDDNDETMTPPVASCCKSKQPSTPAPAASGCCSSKKGSNNSSSQAVEPVMKRAPPLIIAPMNFDGLEFSGFDFNGAMESYMRSTGQTLSPTGSSPLGGVASPEDYYPTIAGVGFNDSMNVSGMNNMNLDMSGLPNSNNNNNMNSHFASPHGQRHDAPFQISLGDFDYLDMAQNGLQGSGDNNNNNNNFLNVVYAPSCVLPGQCQCGDDCSCEGCSTHGNGGGAMVQTNSKASPLSVSPLSVGHGIGSSPIQGLDSVVMGMGVEMDAPQQRPLEMGGGGVGIGLYEMHGDNGTHGFFQGH